MSLSFVGPSGTAEQRWIVYALLRDNVQHYLEAADAAATDFASIHGIEQALGGRRIALNARRLREEVEKAATLLARPIADLAIGVGTRSVIEGSRATPAARVPGTSLADGAASIPWLSPEVRTLDDVFGNLVRSLLSITQDAGEADLVEVDDA